MKEPRIVYKRNVGMDISEQAVERATGGQILCLEAFSCRWFISTPKAVNEAIKAFNENYKKWKCASLNDLYEELDIMQSRIGQTFGWTRGTEDWEESPEEIVFRTGWINVDGKYVFFLEPDGPLNAPFEGWEQL